MRDASFEQRNLTKIQTDSRLSSPKEAALDRDYRTESTGPSSAQHPALLQAATRRPWRRMDPFSYLEPEHFQRTTLLTNIMHLVNMQSTTKQRQTCPLNAPINKQRLRAHRHCPIRIARAHHVQNMSHK